MLNSLNLNKRTKWLSIIQHNTLHTKNTYKYIYINIRMFYYLFEESKKKLNFVELQFLHNNFVPKYLNIIIHLIICLLCSIYQINYDKIIYLINNITVFYYLSKLSSYFVILQEVFYFIYVFLHHVNLFFVVYFYEFF